MVPRLYVDADLQDGGRVAIDADAIHYLKNVLRRREGDAIRVFNGEYGEFDATIAAMGKKGGEVLLLKRNKPPSGAADLVLAFAPIKRTPTEYLIQKATELGVSRFEPVITERTNVARVAVDRLTSIGREAAEQSGRLTVPAIAQPVRLDAFLATFPPDRYLVFCDEAGDDPAQEWGGSEGRAAPMLDVLQQLDAATLTTILIGPEGGFSPTEREAIRGINQVQPVTLGPRILRADTAGIVALALLQAAMGDLGTVS
ncbi:MAG: 16S rRNA (uracil(1498)-N(3))-methyltransferase [Pseudomonadota bacterium]